MKKIYVYCGEGAFQAKDVENFLTVFDLDYERICEHNLDILKSRDIFIVPGGMIRAYLPTWGKSGIKIIRNFVKNGGTYLGICAGAYVTGKRFLNHKGLNFFEETLRHSRSWKIVNVFDNKNKKIQLIKENGPDLSSIRNAKVLLKDKKGTPYAMKLDFGKGKVYLFSSHPEGSVYYKKFPQNFSGAKYFLSLLKRL